MVCLYEFVIVFVCFVNAVLMEDYFPIFVWISFFFVCVYEYVYSYVCLRYLPSDGILQVYFFMMYRRIFLSSVFCLSLIACAFQNVFTSVKVTHVSA